MYKANSWKIMYKAKSWEFFLVSYSTTIPGYSVTPPGLGHRNPGSSNRLINQMFSMISRIRMGLVFTHMCNGFLNVAISCSWLLQRPDFSHGFTLHPPLVSRVLRESSAILTKRSPWQPKKRALPCLTIHIINQNIYSYKSETVS